MKKVFLSYACGLSICLLLISCREYPLLDRSYQRVYVNNFSKPIRSILPARDKFPSSMTLRITGTVNRPVTVSIAQLESGQRRYVVLEDSLAAGTYADRNRRQDFYSLGEVELQVVGAPETVGSLAIEWYCQ